MARGRKGQAVSGWVVVDKPAGLGSTPVVARVRRAFDAAKAGHAGTLDPDATGVLAVALGEATKTIPWLDDTLKTYVFAIRWGAATTTDDAAGAVLETSHSRPTRQDIAAALPAFRGDIRQVPPQVSAVHVDGQRAYDLARAGAVMDLAARDLHVDALDLLEMPDADTAVLRMVCGTGGYVRAVARDLGRALGCLGHALWLRRTGAGPFDQGHAVTLDDIAQRAEAGTLADILLPPQAALPDLPQVFATEGGAVRLSHGNPGEVAGPSLPWGAEAWASHQGRLIAIGHVQGGMLHPVRVLNP